VAVNGTLLAAAAPPAGAGNATPGPEASVAPAATAGDSAQRRDGTAADTSPAPAGPRQVTLSELSFRRYVEPRDRRGTRAPAPAGWVELGFTVGTDGEPREITITDSSPPGRYEESALAAVRRWRFEPVIEGGQAVERRTGVRLRFQPE
jgi:protein TonB